MSSMQPYVPKFAYNHCVQIAGVHIPQNCIYMQIVEKIPSNNKKPEYKKAYVWVDMNTILTRFNFKVNYLTLNDKHPKKLTVYSGSRIQKILHEFAMQKLEEFREIRFVKPSVYELGGLMPNNRLTADYKNWV